jgi:hypothetical protein
MTLPISCEPMISQPERPTPRAADPKPLPATSSSTHFASSRSSRSQDARLAQRGVR